MGKGHGWFGLRRDSSGGKSQAPQFPDDPNDEQLCGVGVVLYKAPDNSLFVKALVEGSSACNSGILPGDCLVEVNGKNVYCKGIELATKAILGKEGSVVTLKLIRIDRGKRIPISASLVREMKATANPEFSVKSEKGGHLSSGVCTSQVFLECLQQERRDGTFPDSAAAGAGGSPDYCDDMPAASRVARDESTDADDGAGVFSSSGDRSLSSSRSSSRTSSFCEGGGGQTSRPGDGAAAQGREGECERKVKYRGKWYTESEIAALELKAQQVKLDMDCVANGISSPRLAAGPTLENRGPSVERRDQRLVVGPSLVDLGKGPKQMSRKELSLNSDPEALKAAIIVVEGMKLEKVSSRKVVGKVLKTVHLKMSTGGVLTWGKGKEGHVMWVRPQSDLYDPGMSKRDFEMLQRRFFVMLEGDQVMAHSSQGGTIRACEAAAALEFVAASREERDIWVKGINMVLGMSKKEALERETKNRMKEVHAAASRVPSVFITAVPGAKTGSSFNSTADACREQVGAKASGDEEALDANAFGSKEQRESVRRAADRGRKGWGGKIAVSTTLPRPEESRCDSDESSEGPLRAADSPPLSQLSSTSTQPRTASGSTPEGSNRPWRPPACAATCWPPVSPGNANKKKALFSFPSEQTHEETSLKDPASSEWTPEGGALSGQTLSASDDHIAAQRMRELDTPPAQVPPDKAPPSVATVPPPQPSSGDSEILSEMTTAEDTPRVTAAAAATADKSAPAASAPLPSSASTGKDTLAFERARGAGLVSGEEPTYPSASQAAAPALQVASRVGAALPKLVTSASSNPSLPAVSNEHREATQQASASPGAPDPAATMMSPAANGSGPTEGAHTQTMSERAEDAPAVLAPTTTRHASEEVAARPPPSTRAETGASAPQNLSASSRPKDSGHIVSAACTSASRQQAAAVAGAVPGAKEESVKVGESLAAGERKLHSRQNGDGTPAPGRIAAPKKQDFAALMAARQQKMREAEEADEGMYFD